MNMNIISDMKEGGGMQISQNTIIKKIPGDLSGPSKKENQGYIEDLKKMQGFELEELLERQNKILVNKSFVLRLPDKGARITDFRNRILRELDRKNEVEKAANLLSRLNLASEGKDAMNELEWTGKYNEEGSMAKITQLDSDDEEDPLKILAQPTGTGVHKKKVVHLLEEDSLINSDDLAEIESFKEEPLNKEHVKYIVDKVEKTLEGDIKKKKASFKPYKTTKSDIHDPVKEKERKLKKNWEVTAATPPLIVHGAAKVLNLTESLKLQKEQAQKLQKIQAQHAAEKLVQKLGLRGIGPLPGNIANYRLQDVKDSSSSSEDEEFEANQVHDEEDNDKQGTVVFTVDSVES